MIILLRSVAAVAVLETGDECRLGVDVKMAVDIFHIAVGSMRRDLKMSGDFPPGATLDEKVEHGALPGG